jgi:lipoate-protein ligase B
MADRRLRIIDLADRDYARVLELQRSLVERVAAGEEPPTLLLVEHEAVVTTGRRGARPPGAIEVERGGGVTWHGPGQLVGYAIVPVADHDLRAFLRRLEQGLIDALAGFGLAGARREGLTGVWVDGRKIASIGIAVRRWVAFHGFGLNVATDLAAFAGLDPCGLDAAVMTSLSHELGRDVAVDEARRPVADAVAGALGLAAVSAEGQAFAGPPSAAATPRPRTP